MCVRLLVLQILSKLDGKANCGVYLPFKIVSGLARDLFQFSEIERDRGLVLRQFKRLLLLVTGYGGLLT